MTVYTLGIWKAKPGCEADFAAAWREFAERTKVDFPGGSAVLLKDRAVPNLFVSTGPWESMEQVEHWRASASFAQGVEKMRQFLEDFEPHTMDPVAVIDP